MPGFLPGDKRDGLRDACASASWRNGVARTVFGCPHGSHTLDPSLANPAQADAALGELLAASDSVIWVDVEAPTDDDYAWLQRHFHFHPLAIEDCRHGVQRPKIDEYEDYLFFVFHAIIGIQGEYGTDLDFVELDGFLGRQYLVTVHDEPLATLDQLKARVEQNPGLLARGADDLFYAALDMAVDLYFPILDGIDQRIDKVEHDLFARPSNKTLAEIFSIKKLIMKLRRFAWPQRDTLSLLVHHEHPAIDERTRYYLRDVVDHLIRITDALDAYRDLIAGATDTYLSQISQRTNDRIKVLSIFATVLLPITMLAGLYGMNFEFLPGAKHPYGFRIMVGLMVAIALALFGIFRWRLWI
jgi:magnesium transporter